jgi:hypothetical protein
MASWFHTTILATGFAATLAIGFASAAMVASNNNTVAAKGDRLTLIASPKQYQTVETRSNGVSTLTRVQVD